MDPAAHAYPATQLPVHPAVVSPAVDPYSPATHSVHTPDPPTLYLPGAHSDVVGLVDPAGHAYPAVQFPLQAGVVRPEVAPYVPAGHAPVHPAVGSPDDAPYRPAAHGLHTPDPVKLKEPAAHRMAVAEVLPVGHAFPAVQFPLHAAVGSPAVAPNVPAGHGPVHCDEVSPVDDPYLPAGQSEQVEAPVVEYLPVLHTAGVAVVDPATQ